MATSPLPYRPAVCCCPQDGVGQTSSLALRKQKALELARTCSTPYLRALLRQGTDVPMVEKVMDTVAAAMVRPAACMAAA